MVPPVDAMVFCPFAQHKWVEWETVVEEDRSYVEWLVGGDGPSLGEELYDTLIDLLEETG